MEDLGALDARGSSLIKARRPRRSDVLGLVEAERAEIADRAKRPALVAGHDPLRSVLEQHGGRARSAIAAMMASMSQPTPA